MAKFELDTNQQARLDAWFKWQWEVHHKGFRPRDSSGYVLNYIFGPTGCGCNVTVQCVWCAEDSACREVILTIDEDGDGDFLYQYDENWVRLPAAWEKGAT